ncbi:MAG: acetyltransferase, partial [Pseudomonadota bacterium]
WSRRERAVRVIWALAQPLFRCSPRIAWGWRRAMLRRFGASVGADVNIHPTTRIAIPWTLTIDDGAAIGDRAILYALGPMRIGARATISQNAHLCGGTHDHRDPAFPVVRSPITVADDVWIGADAFIGPGVEVGDGAIVGARAVVVRDVPPGATVVGNPARVVQAGTIDLIWPEAAE